MIKFFYMEGCSCCERVRKKLGELKLDCILKDIEDETNWKELMKLAKKNQVPFIVDGNVRMLESDDIVKYIEKKYRRNENANRRKSPRF